MPCSTHWTEFFFFSRQGSSVALEPVLNLSLLLLRPQTDTVIAKRARILGLYIVVISEQIHNDRSDCKGSHDSLDGNRKLYH